MATPFEGTQLLKDTNHHEFSTDIGYLTQITQKKYIEVAVADGVLPKDAHRMPDVISLSASKDTRKPIQFWQLYSVLGQDRIVGIVSDFYQRVFADELWFSSVFARVGGMDHHIGTQASMWIDVMGGGPYYNGGEFRLSFHHTHNAHQLMDQKGAKRWVELMVGTLEACDDLMTDDPRVRLSINTFLTHFFGKYASEFGFENRETFGATNPALRRKVNFMNMTSDAIEALSENELRAALTDRGVDITGYKNKGELVNKALNL